MDGGLTSDRSTSGGCFDTVDTLCLEIEACRSGCVPLEEDGGASRDIGPAIVMERLWGETDDDREARPANFAGS